MDDTPHTHALLPRMLAKAVKYHSLSIICKISVTPFSISSTLQMQPLHTYKHQPCSHTSSDDNPKRPQPMMVSAWKKRCLKLSTGPRRENSASARAPTTIRHCTGAPNMLKPAEAGITKAAAAPETLSTVMPFAIWSSLLMACKSNTA